MRMSEDVDLYLDLLKRSLTNTIFADEPDASEDPLHFTMRRMAHYVKGAAVSMLPLARMDNIQNCVMDVLNRNVPGDFIETGVWRGGATILMRAILKARGVTDRVIWVADSFEGLPTPDPDVFPLEAKAHSGSVIRKGYNNLAVGLEEVQRNFTAYGLLDEQVKFLKGWFKNTLPDAPIERLAIMRLDGDFYESTLDGLTNLYDRLSVGGYVIVDDYGEDAWTYCRQAVDEFRRDRFIDDPIVAVDQCCVYWRRSR